MVDAAPKAHRALYQWGKWLKGTQGLPPLEFKHNMPISNSLQANLHTQFKVTKMYGLQKSIFFTLLSYLKG